MEIVSENTQIIILCKLISDMMKMFRNILGG